MSADATIQDILAKYGEDVRSATWKVQSATVIYHRAIERIAAKAGIKFDPPQILRAERDEAVILVTGRLGDMTVWSIGEAMVNVNYRVSGKQAAYVWAMAEKRAVDRVVLKLIGLHGIVYSENEADEFKRGRGSSPASEEMEYGDEPEDNRSSSQRIADDMVAALAERAGARVDRFIDNPQVQRDLGALDREDFERVLAFVNERRAVKPEVRAA